MSVELKPCPFCGSKNLKIEKKGRRAGYNGLDIPVYNMTYSVRCQKCHARGATAGGRVLSYTLGFKNPDWAKTQAGLYEESIEAWNRRAET